MMKAPAASDGGIQHERAEPASSGEPRRASQKRSRPAAPKAPETVEIPWKAGDRVRWRDRVGAYRRDTGDGEHVEIVVAERVYRVRRADLRQ